MSCPRCGGTSSRPISPTSVECTNVVYSQVPGPGFGAPPPTGRFGPVWQQSATMCGHRYAVAPNATVLGAGVLEQCKCGVYAIGHCQTCGSAVCGGCSSQGASLRCWECKSVEDRKVVADQAAEVAARLASLQAKWHTLVTAVLAQRPPFNAELTHMHFFGDGHVIKSGYVLGQHQVLTTGRRGKAGLAWEPNLENSLMPVSELTKRTVCPIHGEGCTVQEIKKSRHSSYVIFALPGWQIGVETYSHTVAADTEYDDTRPIVLTGDGAIAVHTSPPRRAPPMSFTDLMSELARLEQLVQ